jgi:hypothetical protein
MPPSARSAAPLLAEASVEATYIAGADAIGGTGAADAQNKKRRPKAPLSKP